MKMNVMSWIERMGINWYFSPSSSHSYESIDNVMKELGFSGRKARLGKPFTREYTYCPHNITLKARVLLSEENPEAIGIFYEGPLALGWEMRDRLKVFREFRTTLMNRR